MDTNLTIVCFTGGTCGDLIYAMIDPRDVSIASKSVTPDMDRSRLKKPHLFSNDDEKDQYLDSMALRYNSIPSHDLDYHISRGHNFITITVQDFDHAIWAASRFKELHRPQVWQEMQDFCGAKSIEDYAQILIDYSNMVVNHTNQVISMESIRSGGAVEELSKYVVIPDSGKEIYQDWLSNQHD